MGKVDKKHKEKKQKDNSTVKKHNSVFTKIGDIAEDAVSALVERFLKNPEKQAAKILNQESTIAVTASNDQARKDLVKTIDAMASDDQAKQHLTTVVSAVLPTLLMQPSNSSQSETTPEKTTIESHDVAKALGSLLKYGLESIEEIISAIVSYVNRKDTANIAKPVLAIKANTDDGNHAITVQPTMAASTADAAQDGDHNIILMLENLAGEVSKSVLKFVSNPDKHTNDASEKSAITDFASSDATMKVMSEIISKILPMILGAGSSASNDDTQNSVTSGTVEVPLSALNTMLNANNIFMMEKVVVKIVSYIGKKFAKSNDKPNLPDADISVKVVDDKAIISVKEKAAVSEHAANTTNVTDLTSSMHVKAPEDLSLIGSDEHGSDHPA